MNGPLVVGVDLSLTATGVASSDGWTRLVKSKATGPERIIDVWEQVERVALGPQLVVLEGLSYASKGGQSHDQVPGLWWYVTTHLWQAGVRYAVAPPSSVKKYATGKGTADKGAVVDACARRLPQFGTDGNNNLADAVWLMAAGRDHLGHPVVAVPSVNREALAKVQWPAEDGALL